jgi:hypothetical protein
MSNIAERVSRLEGEHGHLATKAEVADLKTEIAQLESRLLRYTVATVLAGAATGAAVAGIIVTLLK